MINIEKVNKVLENYNIEEKTPIALLRESSDNFVYIIGENSKNILRMSKRLPKDEVVFESELLAHLDLKGVKVPKIVKAKDGNNYSIDDDDIFVMFSFIEGKHVKVDIDNLPSELQAYNAGANFGQLTESLRDFVPTVQRKRNIFSELKRVFIHKEKFRNEFEGGAEFVSQVEEAIEFGNKNMEKLSTIHNDYRPSNVFFGKQDEVIGTIDFDWSCVGPSIKDLALAVVEWSFPDGLNEQT